ncbi:hypothetical protein RHPLAN_45370 [Rhodoplanes sp. Z2-YC6860]|nr:hypothetical protein RHPLAN_45370 [Rhodoplanes sp. Z2-YC6860]
MLMLPYLVAAIILIGLPTLSVAVRYREYRKFLAGAFFVSSGMQFYFYLAKIPIPLIWTGAVQPPELSAARGTIHFVLFLVCLYFGWFFRAKPRANEDGSGSPAC